MLSFLCSAFGPFIHVCSPIFAGFHSVFLHPPLLYVLLFFFLAVKYLMILKVQGNFD